MLKRGMLSPPDTKVAARIARSADRMSKIIAQLLDFTRAHLGGGITIDPKPMDLTGVCAEVIAVAETSHPDRTVRLDAHGDTRGVWDRERLAQVVSNLIGNALQHGKSESEIDVRLAREGDAVSLRVHNEGPAIPQDLLPVIFDPFRRQRFARPGERRGPGARSFHLP